METVNLKLRANGVVQYRERLDEKIKAFTEAADELAAMVPGELEIEVHVKGYQTTEGIVAWMREQGLQINLKMPEPPKLRVFSPEEIDYICANMKPTDEFIIHTENRMDQKSFNEILRRLKEAGLAPNHISDSAT